ncbi:unnamed protein product, partial [Rotaria sp. Silwood1]
MLKNMTHEQLNIFYYVRDWCLRKRANQDIDCLRLFITGGAGTGKSHLLKCIYYEATKILNEINNDNSNEIRTLICAPTNAAALNMNCTTMHSTFKIVDQSLWRELHTRLSQITCKTGSNIYFGNVSIVAVGDFYQLPPVKGIPLYLSINVIDYWQNLFEYSELTICQRTKEADFYALANRIQENANRDDGIVKGAFGNVVEIVFDSNKKDFVDHIRIKFDNPDCGRQHQKICEICRKEKTVCIQ